MAHLTEFDKCKRDFWKLTAPVNDDPMGQSEIADLVSAAVFELDLQEAGEQDPALTRVQITALRRFVEKWRK